MPIPSTSINEFIINDKDTCSDEDNYLPNVNLTDYDEFTINDLLPSTVEHINNVLTEYPELTINDLPPEYFELVWYLDIPLEVDEEDNNVEFTVNDLPTDLAPNTISYLSNVMNSIPVASLDDLPDAVIEYIYSN